MRLNALINACILVIQIFSLVSECQGPFGIYCSTIRTSMASQLFKIIFCEYVSNCLRLISHSVYVGFAVNRLSLIGKEHGKLVDVVSKLTVKQFISRTVWPCLILPVVKVFRFLPNYILPDYDYPNPIAFYFNLIPIPLLVVYVLFNFLCDLVNYGMFFVLNLVIDLKLVFKMKQTIDEKEKK